MVLKVKGMPASSAACAAKISPLPCMMPVKPVGAMANGIDAVSPTKVVPSCRCPTSIISRWRS